MLFNTAELTDHVNFSKNLITDQNFNNIMIRTNSAGIAFSPTLGLGEAASNTSVWVFLVGGFADQRMTATMRYVAPTAQAASEIGVMGRFTGPLSTGHTTATYYYARVDGGVAKITRVLAGAFTDLITGAYNLAQNVDVTIAFSCVGSQLRADFSSSGPGNLTLEATDSNITVAGCGGCRSQASSIYCSSFQMEQI